MANLDIHRTCEIDPKKRIREKLPKHSTIKINKEVKVLFDELICRHQKKQVDFVKDLLIEWCKHQDKDIYERYKNHELPGQESQ
ncbi:TPA: hypothetical protein PF714_002587 [Staphylococcus aureus]|uniref:hypothetical protein n=1 Tax=Staphylococcus aureus TaxID=1280 RepID=UPI00139CBE12|nr:hypothetical protein [Staphylococcus aureus]NDP30652.1 hypothetical protein [Staphylococcus aureus]NDP32262.1 hypothetical protein [Staphylococcus aureus]NDP54712.1 hypothetical protein [Staphylococcus aureus]NDP96246.1 hypothetical protein [Staphylococcus aureus]NDQ09273.1 hypothetical protein [Staphylococcus aureus]